MLKVAFQFMPCKVLVSMYHAFVMSHTLYGVLVWEKMFSSYLHPVNKMFYNRGIRITLGKTYEHVPPLAAELTVLLLDDLYKYFSCIYSC